MLHRIIGAVGAGKKDRLKEKIRQSFAAGKEIYLLVPEQATARYEREMVTLLCYGAGERVEITNFSRLPDVILRKIGGLADRALSDTEKKLLLFSCMKKLSPMPEVLDLSLDSDSVDALFAELEELRLAGLDAEELDSLCEKDAVPQETKLLLSDLALVRGAFRKTLSSFGDAAEGEELRLARVLRDLPFFRGCDVFVDAFWDFTFPQEKLLREILSQAASLTVSFAGDPAAPLLFDKPLRAARRLKKTALEMGHEVKDEVLSPKENGELSFLKRRLAGQGKPQTAPPSAVSVTAAESPLEEALYLANQIHTLVKEGARWNEILVLHRNEEALPLIALCLEEEGIPVFSEEKRPLLSSPLARTLLLALRIADRKARREELRAYVKKGVYSCPEEEKFLLDAYLGAWNIHVGLALSEKPFPMNPDGYLEFTEENKNELKKVNLAKEMAFAPIRRLAVGLEEETVAEKISALFRFLSEIGAEKILFHQVQEAKDRGDFAAAGELGRHWNTLLSALDEVSSVLGNEKSSREDFFNLLSLALSRSLPGEIPPGQDRVQIAPLGFVRPENSRFVFLCGMNAGVFPAPGGKTGVLGHREKEMLAEMGYPVSTGEREMRNEYFLFYQAIAFAGEKLFLSFVSSASDDEKKHDMSIFLKRVQNIFPALKMHVFRSHSALPTAAEEGFSYALRHWHEKGEGERWKQHFLKTEDFAARALGVEAARAFQKEAFRLKDKLPYEGKDARMSYSRMEKYSNCPFSFFSRYLLEAKVRGKAEFGSNIIGNFAHSVLEKVLLALSLRGIELWDATDEILAEENRIACQAAVAEAMGEEESAAAEHFIRRMEENTLTQLKLLKKEFSVSRFRPTFFEKDLSELSGDYAIPLKDGTKLILGGKIDRVDLYDSPRGKTFVRVVDYKTGNHSFSLDDVANGVSIQMLLYLFALCRRGFELHGKEIVPLPAGILYLNGTVKAKLCHDREELKHREDRPFEDFSVKGLLLQDEEILSAQDPDGNGEFLPVKKKKDGSFSGASALITAEKLGRLSKSVEKIFAQMAESLKEGKIAAKPLYRSKEKNACLWCDYRAICKKGPEDPRRYRTKTGEMLTGGEES